MDIILYNPLSSSGKNQKKAEKFASKLVSMNQEVKTIDLTTITDIKGFLEPLNKEDRLIIFGGDGTIHRIVNQIEGYTIKPQVFMYKAGSGNDFLRTIPGRKKLVDVKQYLEKCATLYLGDQRIRTLNGAGIGLDGLVVYKVNKSKLEKNKTNYFKNSLSSFFKYKPSDLTVTVDGKTWVEKKVWFASSMYGSYFGGGMKIAPKKKRSEHCIELVIVKRIPRLLLLLLFPTIYLGWHRFLFGFVKIYRAQDVKVVANKDCYLQVDGEDKYPVREYQLKIED